MANERRGFIKKTLTAGAGIATVGATAALASGKQSDGAASNGVVVGKSSKKEVLYKETREWEAYYKANY